MHKFVVSSRIWSAEDKSPLHRDGHIAGSAGFGQNAKRPTLRGDFRSRAATLAFFPPAESRDLALGITKTYREVPKLVLSSELELLEVEFELENP